MSGAAADDGRIGGEGRARRGRDAPGAPADDGEAGFGLVEALIAAILLAVGLLAVGGIAVYVAGQTRSAAIRTDQTMAGQQVLEITVSQPYADIGSGASDTTVTVGDRDYQVTRNVTAAGGSMKEVEVIVAGAGNVGSTTFRTRVHLPKTL